MDSAVRNLQNILAAIANFWQNVVIICGTAGGFRLPAEVTAPFPSPFFCLIPFKRLIRDLKPLPFLSGSGNPQGPMYRSHRGKHHR